MIVVIISKLLADRNISAGEQTEMRPSINYQNTHQTVLFRGIMRGIIDHSTHRKHFESSVNTEKSYEVWNVLQVKLTPN